MVSHQPASIQTDAKMQQLKSSVRTAAQTLHSLTCSTYNPPPMETHPVSSSKPLDAMWIPPPEQRRLDFFNPRLSLTSLPPKEFSPTYLPAYGSILSNPWPVSAPFCFGPYLFESASSQPNGLSSQNDSSYDFDLDENEKQDSHKKVSLATGNIMSSSGDISPGEEACNSDKKCSKTAGGTSLPFISPGEETPLLDEKVSNLDAKYFPPVGKITFSSILPASQMLSWTGGETTFSYSPPFDWFINNSSSSSQTPPKFVVQQDYRDLLKPEDCDWGERKDSQDENESNTFAKSYFSFEQPLDLSMNVDRKQQMEGNGSDPTKNDALLQVKCERESCEKYFGHSTEEKPKELLSFNQVMSPLPSSVLSLLNNSKPSQVIKPPSKRKFKEKIPCKICGKMLFPSARNISDHMNTHSGCEPYKCTYCEKSFKSSPGRLIHIRRIHEEYLKCPFCYGVFTSEAKLYAHTCSPGTDERPFKCEHCDRSFKQAAHLRSHIMNIHERVLKCPLCDRCYGRWTSLELHLRTHSNERPFGCEYCEWSFKQKSNLRVHVRQIHGKELKRPLPSQ